MAMIVRELMSRQPVCLQEGATIDEAVAVLVREQAVELYLLDRSGRLTGVVPDYELLKARLGRCPGCDPVESLASRQLVTLHPDNLVAEIAPLFRDGRHRQVAVIEGGRLVGQIERRHILRLLVCGQVPETEPETPAVLPMRAPQAGSRREAAAAVREPLPAAACPTAEAEPACSSPPAVRLHPHLAHREVTILRVTESV